MVHWMLVLFMGATGTSNVVKTDLVFEAETACFNYEEQLSERHVGLINSMLSKMREDKKSQEEIERVREWMGLEFPRGTCIPTTSAVTTR